MKNLNLLFVLFISVLMFSCGGNKRSTIDKGSIEKTEARPVGVVKEKAKERKEVRDSHFDLSNPSLFMGSDFGQFFLLNRELGEYNTMIKFTSKESISKHGEDKVLKFYENMNPRFLVRDMKPFSKKGKAVITVSYRVDNHFDRGVKRIDIVIENDTCKVLLPDNLNEFMK